MRKHIRRVLWAAIACLVLLTTLMLTGCGPQSSPSGQQTHTDGHAGPAYIYPDANLTPGDTIAGVTERDVCTPGYASRVRHVSSAEKRQVYREYGMPNVRGQAEVDHFISLELGGSNDIKNLWPERYDLSANGQAAGAHEKDKVENYLHAQVCSGNMTLKQAQDSIRGDWYKVYLQISH